jgi:PAS domain S-box-containing protein
MRRILIIGIFISLVTCSSAAGKEGITIGIMKDAPPISFRYENTNRIRGIGVDIGTLLGRVIHEPVTFKMGNLPRLMEYLGKGTIDVICCLPLTPDIKQNYHTISSGITNHRRLFVNCDCRTVVCSRDLAGKNVIFISGDPYKKTLQQVDRIRLIEAKTSMEALKFLENDLGQVFVAPSEAVALYLIQQNEFKNISMTGMPVEISVLGMVIKKGNAEMLTTLSIAFGKLMEKGSIEIVRDKWINRPIDFRWEKFYKYILWGAMFAVLMIGIIATWNFFLKRKVHKVTQDLLISRKRYQDLIESSPDMIFLINARGDILHANEQVKTATFYDSMGQVDNIHDFVIPGQLQDFELFLSNIFQDKSDRSEFIFKTSKREGRGFDIAGRVIEGSQADEQQACLFARDVTQRNRMENELMQADRLVTIGKMAASVAHEINNPLGIILANAEELHFKDQPSEAVDATIDAIERNAARAGKIAERLMALASPNAFKEDVVDVKYLVQDSAALLVSHLKHVDFEMQFPEEKLLVKGDQTSLQQVIVNLLINSINSLQEDRKIIVTGQANDGIVQVILSDSGCGIPKSNLTKIFEAFFTSTKNGFGLGLFISRRIIEKHEGFLFAESTLGKGTDMYIELPQIEASK